jgi:hypothetical protein
MREKRRIQSFSWETLDKEPLERPRHKWYNIEMDLPKK